MNYETIIYEKDGPVATVTFNRPEKHNPWSAQVSEEIVAVFSAMENDPDVLVTILTGQGKKAFSAGADLANPKTHRVTTVGEHLATVTPRGFAVFNTVADYPKPVVAAVNGYAIGIGCLITLCCDIILAAENAEFGLPQVPLGIIPAYGGAVRLARYVGRGKAMEMVLLGERITAAEAYRVGLANKVVPLAELMPLARDYAERLAALPPLAVRLAKESLNKGLDIASLKDAAQVDIYRFMLLGQTEDSHEAHQAWREKRKPVFTGR
ncbi:MAG TPA: enoyl-CoA hydratase/isomerase family protein [Methylomirabilota bacterium]|jgi:enoyl-CoA hydratase/carnithine racemase|nr:enoyl-CoA hydratase/isomerase family protein [Methylomirabilota bacterium]